MGPCRGKKTGEQTLFRQLRDRIKVSRKGFQPRVIMVVTTLLDAEIYSKSDLMELFAQRWHCELDLRSVKCSLGMRELKCKTPEMVRKELWMYLLAYNLIRARMAQAAAFHDKPPKTLSFQSAKTFINVFMAAIERTSAENEEALETELSRSIARCRVGNRPGRKEPRAVKKRDQKFPKLKKCRAEARKELT